MASEGLFIHLRPLAIFFVSFAVKENLKKCDIFEYLVLIREGGFVFTGGPSVASLHQDDNCCLQALVIKLDITSLAYAIIKARISNTALFLKP